MSVAGPADPVAPEQVRELRAFTRFYTQLLGVIQPGLLATPFSATEARVLYELAQSGAGDVADLRARLGMDSGYTSRILARFSRQGLITRERPGSDARRRRVRLTAKGRSAFRTLDARAAAQAGQLLQRLAAGRRGEVVRSMRAIREGFGEATADAALVLRAPGPGDLGWVVARHGELYAREYGWDESFEALVARIVADWVDHFVPRREAGWIAELGGERAGCVFCMRKDDEVAQLRILLVEPWARGRGVGRRLVEECIRFARAAGYRRMVLWTNDVLVSARRIYEAAGFRKVRQERHHSFGKDLVGQFWEREL